MADSLRTASELMKSGKKAEAAAMFARLVTADANSEQAWLGLAACISDVNHKRDCLKQVLRINPQNSVAEKTLAQMEIELVLRASRQSSVADAPFPPQGNSRGETAAPPPLYSNAPGAGLAPSSSGLNLGTAVILGLLGLIQILASLFIIMADRTLLSLQGSTTGSWVLALCNIPLGIVLFASIRPVLRYGKKVPREMKALAVIGLLAVIGAVLTGLTGTLGLCVAPLYFLPLLLVYIEKERYIN